MIAGITASTRRFQGGGFVIKTTDGVVSEIEGPGEVPGTGVSVDAYGQITGGPQLEEVLAWPEEKPDWLEGDGFMFSYATNLTKVPDTLPAWITDMTYMFAGCPNFNQDLSSWDTGNVKYMSSMFRQCTSFDQDLSSWDTSKVIDMSWMFQGCSSFNGDLSGWDTSNVLVMTHMFRQCTSFDQDLSSWDTSKVTDMAYMFAGCSNFNQDLSSWDTGNVTSMSSIFTGCSSFNGDISSWDTSNVTDMSNMFEQCPNFNGDLSGWDTSEVKYMSSMFEKCSNFNQDLSSWDTSKVTNMSWMFQGCSSFNQDLSGWCVSNISSEPSNFSGAATSWTLPKPVWGTCPQRFIRLDYRDAVEGSVGAFSAFGKYNGGLISGQPPAFLGEPVYRNGFYYHPVVYTDGSQSFTIMRISQEPEIDFNGSSGQAVLDNLDSAGLDRIEVTYAGVVSGYVVPRGSYTPSGNFLEIQAGPWPSQVVYNSCKSNPVGNFIKLFWN